jgi:hypothetical protein
MLRLLSIMILLLVFSFVKLYAQKKEVTMSSITGSMMISTDGKSIFYNMGGPGIKFTKDKLTIGFNMLPSLRFFKDDPRPLVTPLLGAGLIIGYKRFIIGMPVYYLAAKTSWIISGGIGVKLGK